MPRSQRILLAFVLLVTGCGTRGGKPPAEKPARGRTSKGHYSEKYQYHVAYPPGTQASPAEGPNAGDEGEFFTVESGGASMEGEVSGDPRHGDTPASARCEQRIQVLQRFEDHDVKPDPAPQFAVTYKVVKPDWYVFSGTRGDQIFYEKGITHDATVLTLRLYYPASKKDIFNPIAAGIANSFELYLELTAKAGVMTGEDGEAGLLFLGELPGEEQNEHTTCSIDVPNRAQFAKVEEGQTVTVAGQPEVTEIRRQTDAYSAVYERRLKHCVLKNPQR